MRVITEQRRRRTPVGPAVVLRMPPPLDPPVEPTLEPALDMDQLPFEWPSGPPPAAIKAPRPRPAPAPGKRSSAYPAAQKFVSLCVEILNGYRPPNQLRPMVHPKTFGEVSDQILRRTVRIRMTPGEAARQGLLVRARRLLVSEPLEGVAEGVAVLEHGEATWAMAIRMERTGHRGAGVVGWICTVVVVL